MQTIPGDVLITLRGVNINRPRLLALADTKLADELSLNLDKIAPPGQ